MKDDGLNMVETYVFWNLHEPTQLSGSLKYNFEGYANLTLFLEKAASAGLFVNLRIGPYVCAEWNWGRTPSLLPLCYLLFSVFSFFPCLCHVCSSYIPLPSALTAYHCLPITLFFSFSSFSLPCLLHRRASSVAEEHPGNGSAIQQHAVED